MAKRARRGLHYRGLGHISGIPARDLTPEEVEAYGGLEYLLSRQNGHGGMMFEEFEEEVADELRHNDTDQKPVRD